MPLYATITITVASLSMYFASVFFWSGWFRVYLGWDEAELFLGSLLWPVAWVLIGLHRLYEVFDHHQSRYTDWLRKVKQDRRERVNLPRAKARR